MKVYIMRGLPGSGKSELINRNRPGLMADTHSSWVICSADHYHMVDGEYRFDPKNAGLAHGECLRQFCNALQPDSEVDVVVVDNTNTTAVELAPYVRLCEAFGVEYEIVFVGCEFSAACDRNVHQVPAATIWSMYQNLLTERLPAWWKQTFIKAQR